MPEEFTALDEIHDEVDAEFILKDVVHGHDERMLNVIEDFLFELKALEEVLVDYYVFTNAFHSIDLAVDPILGQIDLAESTFSDHLHYLKVLETDSGFLIVLASEDQSATLSHCLPSRRLLT